MYEVDEVESLRFRGGGYSYYIATTRRGAVAFCVHMNRSGTMVCNCKCFLDVHTIVLWIFLIVLSLLFVHCVLLVHIGPGRPIFLFGLERRNSNDICVLSFPARTIPNLLRRQNETEQFRQRCRQQIYLSAAAAVVPSLSPTIIQSPPQDATVLKCTRFCGHMPLFYLSCCPFHGHPRES